MFKRICLNIDMKGEMLEALKERKSLVDKTVVGKLAVKEKSKDIEEAKSSVEQLQVAFEQSKVDFENALIQKASALEDMTALHERTEKAKTGQLETAAKTLELISAEVAKLADQSKLILAPLSLESIVDRNIL